MRDDYTHILFIIDDSASMKSLVSDSINGYNSFVEEQTKVDGECRMHTILFGAPDDFRYYTKDKEVSKIPDLTREEHNASGWSTSLLDAIGRGINDLGKFLKDMDEKDRPSKVLVNIFTDGMENSSQEFSKSQIKSMIKEQTDKYSWEFAFLASDLQAVNLAKSVGIMNTAMTDNTSRGMSSSYTAFTNNATMYRKAGATLNVQDEYDNATKEEDEEEATVS